MYYCKDCRELIEDYDLEQEDYGFYTEVWGSSVWNSDWCCKCPFCGSTDVEEAPRCEHCHDYFVPTDDEKDLCEICKSYLEDEGE